MNNCMINGKSYNVPNGANITVTNGELFVNGVKYEQSYKEKIKIEITGVVASVTVKDGDLSVVGDVQGDVKVDGSTTIEGNVNSNKITVGGSFKGGNITGDVMVGGSCHCGDVSGDVSAGGSLHCRK